jgi:glycerophosphoryl diester phosphodiesterase
MKKNILLFLLILLINSANAQYQIIAHRGASFLAPENTVAAAKLAWELGADAVEVDIHLSKDNRVMVIHDKGTKRTSSGKKNLTVKDTPSMLLRDLEVGGWKDEEFKGEKIPFLSEIIKTIPTEKTLVVEIKCGNEVLPHLKKVVSSSGKANQITFISFGWDTILETKKEFPDNKCYWLSAIKVGLKKKMEKAVENNIDGVNLRHNIIDEKIVDLAKTLNMEVLTWTVDDPDEAKRLINLGVKGITTNRSKWLKQHI